MNAPHISTFATGLPFAKTLAESLLGRYGSAEALSRVLLLLPTRRACLAMREAFLTAGQGQAILLPRIEPLGDIDTDLWMTQALYGVAEGESVPPAMPRSLYIMELARMVHYFEQRNDGDSASATMEHAILLAEALADLLDECAREHVPPSALREAVDKAEFARHWEISLAFLEIILTHWPRRERELGMISRAAHQDALLMRLAAQWQKAPPSHPVIAAGSTGSIPATAQLLSTIARLPEGEVILPGVDIQMHEAIWEQLGPTHPQYNIKEALRRMGAQRSQVKPVGEEINAARSMLLLEVMAPPEATHHWAKLEAEGLTAGFKGITCVECDSQEHEAAVVTLRMRAALEEQGKTAMLVTPDRAFARRVSAMLGRYGLRVNDSSGRSMDTLMQAVFLKHVIACADAEAAPVPLLSLLRHPLCRLGREPGQLRRLSREIELRLLRGIRPAGGLQGLLDMARRDEKLSYEAKTLMEELGALLWPLVEIFRLRKGREVAFSTLLGLHMQTAEQMAGAALWEGHEGGKLLASLMEISQHAEALGGIDPASYAGILANLLRPVMYQPPYGGHPRLSILSPMEARLQQADVVILAGLNEHTWPPALDINPWMNAAMRKTVGLPPAERSIGQSAHDVVSLCMAGEVMLTRPLKEKNAPGIPSRWWQRLEAVLGRATMQESGNIWASWGRQLFASAFYAALKEPVARPPLKARPTTLWVTHVEMLMRDPYRYYASHILGLKPLKALDADLTASDFGEVVHAVLERFTQAYGNGLPTDAGEQLEHLSRQELSRHFHHPKVEAFWLPRLRRIAAWFVMQERLRREQGLERVLPESGLERDCMAGDVRFTIKARIDRMEQYQNAEALIVDYKTGSIPKPFEVEAGVACQLLLEAWMLSATIPEHSLRLPEYWKVGGNREAGTVVPLFSDQSAMHKKQSYIEETQQGLQALLHFFTHAENGYIIGPDSDLLPAYNDYEHLQRHSEWLM